MLVWGAKIISVSRIQTSPTCPRNESDSGISTTSKKHREVERAWLRFGDIYICILLLRLLPLWSGTCSLTFLNIIFLGWKSFFSTFMWQLRVILQTQAQCVCLIKRLATMIFNMFIFPSLNTGYIWKSDNLKLNTKMQIFLISLR